MVTEVTQRTKNILAKYGIKKGETAADVLKRTQPQKPVVPKEVVAPVIQPTIEQSLKKLYPEMYDPTSVYVKPEDKTRLVSLQKDLQDLSLGKIKPPVGMNLQTRLEELTSEIDKLGHYAFEREGFKYGQNTSQVLEAIKSFATENPDAFAQDIKSIGRNQDTETLLRAMQVPETVINEMFAPSLEEQDLFKKALPSLVRETNASKMTDYFLNDRDALRRSLITVGRNENTEVLVKSLYPEVTDKELRDYFNPRAPGMALLGELPTRDWLERVREVGKDPLSLVPYVASGKEIVTLAQLMKTALDLEQGTEVSKEDLLALKAYVDKSTMDTTWGYEVTDVLTQLVPFAGELITTGGIFSSGKAVTVKAGQAALKRFATRTGLRFLEGKLGQYGVEVAGTVVGGTLQTIPAGITRIPAATLEKQLQATLTGDEESIWESAAKSLGEAWVETVSERTGGLFTPLTNRVKGQLVKVGLFKAFQRANPGKSSADLQRLMERMGYNGVLGEMLEERIADVGHGVLYELGLGNQEFKLPSARQLSVELASFSVPGVAAKALQSVPDIAGKLTPEIKEALSVAVGEAKARPERGAFEIPGKKPAEVTPAPEVAYDASLEAFRKASREFTAIRNAYRAKEIGDAEYLKGKAVFDKASQEADVAEEVYIKAKASLKVEVSKVTPAPEVKPLVPEALRGNLKSVNEMALDKRITILYPELEELLTKKGTAIDRMGWLEEYGKGQNRGARYAAIRDKAEADLIDLTLKIAREHPELASRTALPKAEPGEPEAGLQPSMIPEVAAKEVRPKGKGRVTQISMDEQLALENYRRAQEADVAKETLSQDPVANYKFTMSGKRVGLESLISIREQTFPEYFTVKQAQALNPEKSFERYTQKGTKDYNKVPKDAALDQLTKEFNMTPDEIADRVMAIRRERASIRELSREMTAEEAGITEPLEVEEELLQEVADYQEAIDAGVPPAERPPEPPQVIIPPSPPVPEMPKDSEIKRIITQSEEQVRQDLPKAFTRLLHLIPGVRQIMEFERPGLKMTDENQKVLMAMVAEQAARSDVSVWAMGTRLKLLKDIREVFGNDVLHGEKSKIKFLGTTEQSKNPITGTLLDMAQNPEFYELSERQLASLTNINIHNDQMLDWVVSNYGAEIGRFTPKPDGAFLPNVDISEDVVEWLSSETRVVTAGRGKTRIWATMRDRMSGKTPVKPELDIQKLIEGLDTWKASVAAGQTYKTAIGGLTRLEAMEQTHPELFNKMTTLRKELNSLKGSAGTIESNIHTAIDDFLNSSVEDTDLLVLKDNLDVRLKAGKRKGLDMSTIQDRITDIQEQIDALRPAWQSANLKPYVFIQEGLFRYFPADQAKLILESRATTSNRLLGIIEKWRGQAFSGDFSPFAIQGAVGVLADPYGGLKAGVGGIKSAIEHRDFLRSVSVEALADDIANNPYEWSQFASLVGRGLTGTPKEYAAGFLSKIPGFDKFTESTYITVTRGGFNLWQREYKNMMKHGIPELEAKVAAADIASKIYPLVSQTRLGQSQARHAVLRSLPTSYSFIRQPVTIIGDATRALGKLVTLQKLTPGESTALKLIVMGAASTMAVSATSAFISAKAGGGDDDKAWQAVLDAINPHPMNGKFLSIIVGNVRIPLGGPYRALFRAMYPAQVKGVPFPVPFAGLPNYLRNRISPAIRTQLDMAPVLTGHPEAATDYNKVQIFNTKDGSVFENILRGLEYEFENFLPLTAGEALESLRQGEKYREPIWQQVIGQFMGVNPVTLDNTYIDRQIKQLGLPDPSAEAKPFIINKTPFYNTQDLWGDVVPVLRKRTAEGFKDKPITLAIIEAMKVKDITDGLLSDRLSNLSDDKWTLLQQRQDLTDTTEFDKVNPQLANIGQREYVLLKEYFSLTDKKAKAQFLEDHPELLVNPRQDYLVSHPKENAQLAVWGQAEILTKEAYNQFLGLVKSLDIPDSAIPEMTLPPEASIDLHFRREELVSEGKEGGAEGELLLLKDFLDAHPTGQIKDGERQSYAEWKNLKVSDKPLEYWQMRFDNQTLYDKKKSIEEDETLDNKIKGKDGLTDKQRAMAELRATKVGDETFHDVERRVDAMGKGSRDNPIPQDVVDSYISHYQIVDKTSGNSAEAKLNRYDNSTLNDFLMSEDYWGKSKAEPLDEDKNYLDNYLVPRWRIDVKYRKEDAEYQTILDRNDSNENSPEAKAYMAEHEDYRKDDRRRKALAIKGKTGERFPLDQVEAYVNYYEIPKKGYQQERYRLENTGLDAVLTNPDIMGDKVLSILDPTKIPDRRYDEIYLEFQDLFDEWDSYGQGTSPDYISDEKQRAEKRAGLLARNPDFQQARWEQDAYLLFIGKEEYVPEYVGYQDIVSKGKPEGAKYWFDDDWYILDHPEFWNALKEEKRKTEPNWGKEKEKGFERVPPRDLFNAILQYDAAIGEQGMSTPDLKRWIRRRNPGLDAWLVLVGAVDESIEEYDKKHKLTSEQIGEMNLTKKRLAIDKLKQEIKEKLKALK